MTLGQKIKQYRTETGLTQKDLVEQLNVAFQTVSKWENGTTEPDIYTLKQLAKLFHCSVDDLINENEVQEAKEEPQVIVSGPAPVPVVEHKTVIVEEKHVHLHPGELHVCARCKKDIQPDDLDIEHVPHEERSGRIKHVTYSDAYYHKDCLVLTRKERADNERKQKQAVASKAKKKCFGWGIAAGVLALVISLVAMLTAGRQQINPGLAVVYSILIGYAGFADLYCILSGSYIDDVFTDIFTWSIKFPGVIFSWSWGGFAWLIAIKILFAILGFLFGLFAAGLAIVVSALLASVSFPFILIHNVKTQYEDAY